MVKRIMVLCSGGDAPGMNAAIRGVVRAAASRPNPIEVYGCRNGYDGLIDDQSDSSKLLDSSSDVVDILAKGGTFLRTRRSMRFIDAEYRKIAADNMKKRGISGLIVIGGNGSLTGAKRFFDEHGQDIQVMGIPASIDNDLSQTKMSIGVDTAVCTSLDAIDRIRDTASSHKRAFLVQVMGRKCPYLPAIIGLAGGAHDIVYPRENADVGKLSALIHNGFSSKKPKSEILIIVSEGIEQIGGKPIPEEMVAAPIFPLWHAIELEISNRFRAKYEIRPVVLGYAQRGGSPTAYDRVLATQFATHAVDAIADGENGKMTVLRSGGPVDDVIELEDLVDPIPERKSVPVDLQALRLRSIYMPG